MEDLGYEVLEKEEWGMKKKKEKDRKLIWYN